jgi:pimeloyl-ACP methyl ester carboxylesterase
VLLVHGQPGLGSDWEAVAARLSDHRLLLVDRPGYGASGDEPTTMAGNAALLAELLTERGAAPATVVGHSYGGGIAIVLAATHPELVSGLVLVASTGLAGSLNSVDRALAAPVVGEALSAVGLFALGRVLPRLRRVAGVGSATALQWVQASLPDDTYRATSTQLGRRVWHSFVVEQRALLREIGSVESALASVRAPTVVISGSWDVVVPPAVSAGIAAAISGSELVSVARTGHFVPRDAPEVVASAVCRVEARADAVGRPRHEQDTGA